MSPAPRSTPPTTPAAVSSRVPRVVVAWVVAAATILAAGATAWVWIDQLGQQRAHDVDEAAARAATLVAGDIETHIATLTAAADLMLTGDVSVPLVEQVAAVTASPFALVLGVDPTVQLGAYPDRVVDVSNLFDEFFHLAQARDGQPGVGERIESGTGDVGTGLAVPFEGADGSRRTLSTVFWFDGSDMAAHLAGSGAGLAAMTLALEDRTGAMLVASGPGAAEPDLLDRATSRAPVADTGWTVIAVDDLGLWRTETVLVLVAALLVVLVILLTATAFHRAVRTSLVVAAAHQRTLEVLQQQEEFLAVASHELRTPVTIVTGFASGLQDHWEALDDEARRTYLDRLAGGATRLTNLVEDLLTTLMTRAGRIELHAEAVLVRDLVDDSIAGSRINDDDVEVDVPDGLAVAVDPRYGPRIIANLLDNAAKYGRPPVEVVARGCGDHVEIHVRDHGDGVRDDVRDHLFEGYWQSPRHTWRRDGGIGLGLHLVRDLARRSGGEVEHRAPDDGGALFVVRLPADRSNPADVLAMPEGASADAFSVGEAR